MAAQLTLAEAQAIQATASQIKSRRGQILKSMELILLTIDPATRPNYSRKIRDVRFDVVDWASIQESKTPTVFIVDGVVDVTRFATVTRRHQWVITLYGVCKGMNIFEFEEHIADVQECLESNRTMAQSTSKVEILRTLTDNQLFDETKTHLYAMEVEMDFIQKYGDPKSPSCG